MPQVIKLACYHTKSLFVVKQPDYWLLPEKEEDK